MEWLLFKLVRACRKRRFAAGVEIVVDCLSRVGSLGLLCSAPFNPTSVAVRSFILRLWMLDVYDRGDANWIRFFKAWERG